MTLRRVAAAACVLGAGAVVPPAGGAASVETGWWSAAPGAAAADAPASGIVVQGGPDAATPTAYAAITYSLAPGEMPLTLRLTVAPRSGSVPNSSIALCPLTEPFTPTQGGAMADAPAYDCASRATATPAADGRTYEFRVDSLAVAGALAVAVLPTAPPTRVVFDPPTLESLASEFDAGVPEGSGSSSAIDGTTPADTFSPLPGTALDIPLPPSVEAPPADDAAASPIETGLPRSIVDQTAASGDGGGSRLPAIVFAALAMLAAGLWSAAGRTSAAGFGEDDGEDDASASTSSSADTPADAA